jgi:hypothetical protein
LLKILRRGLLFYKYSKERKLGVTFALTLGWNTRLEMVIMSKKPFGPKAHSTIDYGFAATLFAAPSLFNLKGTARTLCYAFGGAAALLAALTDQPLAIKRVIPFHIHGQIDTPFVPTLLLLPWTTGALKRQNARFFFFSFSAMVLTNYLLTDYDSPG